MVPFVRKTGEGTLDLILETVQVEFNPEGAQQGRVDAKQFYENQFRQADGDNNKYLDMNEARRFGVFDDQTFKMMDRDGDGKLFKEEMDAFIDQDSSISSSRTLLTVVDHGRSFFDVLDIDRNRRLSVRELRAALKKVASWDRNGDGLVAADEIPAHFKLAFGPGQSSLLDRFNFGVGFNQNMRNAAMGSRQAPSWFQKMDHNKDGDLSPREFLGTRDQFRRLDADGDGLIDAAEAAKTP
jgi:Ca2+-binding EF-hand superfamily protein